MAVEEICLGGGCLPQESNDWQEEILQLQQQISDLQSQLETTTNQISATQLAINTIKNDIKNLIFVNKPAREQMKSLKKKGNKLNYNKKKKKV